MRGQLGPDRIKKKIWHVRRVVISCPDTDTDTDTDAAALAAAVGGQEVHNAAVKMLAYEIAQALVLLSRRVSCGSSTLPMVQWLNCRNPTCSRSSPRKRFSS